MDSVISITADGQASHCNEETEHGNNNTHTNEIQTTKQTIQHNQKQTHTYILQSLGAMTTINNIVDNTNNKCPEITVGLVNKNIVHNEEYD